MLRSREVRELVPDHGAVAEHARQRGDVGGGSEEPRVPCDAADRERVFVVHLAAEALPAPLEAPLGRRPSARRPGPERGAITPPPAEHTRAHEVRERRVADLAEAGREHDVAEVAVLELADPLRERLIRGEPHRFSKRGRLFPERFPPREAGGVREDVLEGDPLLVRAAELGHQLAQRHIQAERAVANERQRERGGRELGERRQVEERVGGALRVGPGSLVWTERARSVSVGPASALHAYDRARAERPDRGIHERARGLRRDGVVHAKPVPTPKRRTYRRRTGTLPCAARSPARTAASASSEAGTSP